MLRTSIVAFLTPLGSGMGKKSRPGSGMSIPDHITESFDADPDRGIFGIRDGKIRMRDLG
jgi:hypothetical protein